MGLYHQKNGSIRQSRCHLSVGFAAALGAVAGGTLVKWLWLEKYRQQKDELAVANKEKDILYTWLLLEQKEASLGEYFAAHGLKTAAIMGMNRGGRRLFDALKNCEDVSPAYAVEQDNINAVHEILTVYRLGDDPLPKADCIVICDLSGIPEKQEALQREFAGKIVTLSEVLSWLIEEHQVKPWDGAIRDWLPEDQ